VNREDLVYRQVVTLKDGARVLLRPMVKEDQEALLALFLPVTSEETRYMRHNVKDPALISSWASEVNYEVVFPVVAVITDRIVGIATLHFNQGPYRHRAEMRIFLAKDFRQRGLGGRLVQSIVEVGKRKNIYVLEVQIVSNQVEVIKAMAKAGFETTYVFEDFFILPDGSLRDITHMVMKLQNKTYDF
jgi:acetyltransferase